MATSPKRVKRVRRWFRVVMLRRGNFIVIHTDEFGQVVAFDTHGPVIECRRAPHAHREARLKDILHRRAFERARSDFVE